VNHHEEAGVPPPPEEDTANIVLMVATVAYGEGIMGQTLRRAANMDDTAESRAGFRTWFGHLVQDYMDGCFVKMGGVLPPRQK
ncbi:hypothetical protein, partial [Zavarzinia sp.]|uniref:hypothetical protein n=1 Tax=Zavarzinia sp. TaxID=2027920 RepID=UPI00356B5789